MSGMIQGRPYTTKYAFELETGDSIWVTTPEGPKLWIVKRVQLDRVTGFVNVECNEGGIMHHSESGVFVDIYGKGHKK